MTADYDSFLKITFPYAPASALSYISSTLYPPIYNGSYPYTTPLSRLTLTIAEQHVICNPYFLARGYGNKTHNYIFSVPPALHAEDLSHSFYNGAAKQTPPTNIQVAQELNGAITRFALRGT